MKTMTTTKMINICKIKNCEWNPPTRTDEKHLSHLRASIEKIGLIYPIVTDQQFNLIDGHRRIACCRQLGWTEIPVFIRNDTREEMYGIINANQRRFSGKDLIKIYLVNSKALEDRQKKTFQEIEEEFGKEILETISSKGKSVHIFDIVKRLWNHIGQQIPIERVLDWTLNTHVGNVFKLRTGIEDHTLDGGELLKAIKTNRPLKMRFILDKEEV